MWSICFCMSQNSRIGKQSSNENGFIPFLQWGHVTKKKKSPCQECPGWEHKGWIPQLIPNHSWWFPIRFNLFFIYKSMYVNRCCMKSNMFAYFLPILDHHGLGKPFKKTTPFQKTAYPTYVLYISGANDFFPDNTHNLEYSNLIWVFMYQVLCGKKWTLM